MICAEKMPVHDTFVWYTLSVQSHVRQEATKFFVGRTESRTMEKVKNQSNKYSDL